MLKGIDPLLNADLLHALRAMGHGDEIAVVDANFPAATMAQRLIRLDGIAATRAGGAVPRPRARGGRSSACCRWMILSTGRPVGCRWWAMPNPCRPSAVSF